MQDRSTCPVTNDSPHHRTRDLVVEPDHEDPAPAVAQHERRALAAGRLEEFVHRFPIRAGDSMLVRSGQIHALDAGTLTIGGGAVTIGGPVTLQGLADQINHTPGIPVTASLVQSAPGAFKLVIHCGACMTNRREVLSRIIAAMRAVLRRAAARGEVL